MVEYFTNNINAFEKDDWLYFFIIHNLLFQSDKTVNDDSNDMSLKDEFESLSRTCLSYTFLTEKINSESENW